jgi:NAD(P)H-dependent FMN reductase
MARILAIAGSNRIGSLNQRLLDHACERLRTLGTHVTSRNLTDFDLPLYDPNEEARSGLPAGVLRLKEEFVAHDGFLIASPEYNSSFSPLLKNALDWASRPSPGEPPLNAYRGRVATLLAASPGALGGLRGLVHLRAVLSNIGVLVLPGQMALGKAHEAFKDDGQLKDEAMARMLMACVAELHRVAGALFPTER